MSQVVDLPGREDRTWALLWRAYAGAMRETWAGVPDLEVALQDCERKIRPFFLAMVAPVKLEPLSFGAALEALPPDGQRDLAALLQQVADGLAAEFARRSRDAIFNLANEHMRQATGFYGAAVPT